MPTYEYRREDGTVFECRQGINDDPLSECPDTGQKVIRLISGGGGVVYKGDGWYVTDYKNKKTSDNGAGEASGNGTDTSAGSAADAQQESGSSSGSGESGKDGTKEASGTTGSTPSETG